MTKEKLSSRPEPLLREAKQRCSGGTCCLLSLHHSGQQSRNASCSWAAQAFRPAISPGFCSSALAAGGRCRQEHKAETPTALTLRNPPAPTAIPANFKPRHHDMKPALALNLPLQPVKQIALKLLNLAAAQTRHMQMISLRTPLVEMLLALQVHEIQFIHQPMPLQQPKRPVHGDSIDSRINLPRLAQQLAGIKMRLRRLHNFQNRPPLPRHAQPARHQLRLQSSGCFRLR